MSAAIKDAISVDTFLDVKHSPVQVMRDWNAFQLNGKSFPLMCISTHHLIRIVPPDLEAN